MSIRARMIILSLSIVPHYSLTKISDLTFIEYHNVCLEYYWMVVTTYVHAPSCHDDVHECALTVFVLYPPRKLRLKSSFSYWWLCNISVLTYHILSVDYFWVLLVHLCLVFLCIHAGSWPLYFFLHTVFNSFSFYIQYEFDSFFVWANLNHISTPPPPS